MIEEVENSIEGAEADYLYVNTSQLPNAGNGLFTAINIYKDEVVSYFKGEIISAKEAKLRADANADQYFISLLDGNIMDSMHIECFAKYANDAKGFQRSHFKNNTKISLDENNSICLIATRSIKSGEEIFCGYGDRYWKRHK